MGQLSKGAAFSIGLLAAMPAPGIAGNAVDTPVVGLDGPGVDHGLELQSVGLGQSHPAGPDLSLDPEWRVHGFERNGVEYYQVNDLAGRVQLIVGTVDGLFWELPAGDPAHSVVMPSQHLSVPKLGRRSTVYQGQTFLLVRYWSHGHATWSVEELRTPR